MTTTERPRITEGDVAHFCGPAAFERARRYYQNGHVVNPRLKGNLLIADVLGSQSEPYAVEIKLFDEEIGARCDCPNDDDFCKHIGAVLLAWIRAPHIFVLGTAAASAGERVPSPLSATSGNGLSTIDDLLPDELNPVEQWRELLEGRTMAELRQIARRRGVTVRGSSKAEVIEHLAAGLVTSDGLCEAVATLTPAERVVLDLVGILADDALVKTKQIGDALASLGVDVAVDPAVVLLDLRDRGLLAAGPHADYYEDAYCLPPVIRPFLQPAEYLVPRVPDPPSGVTARLSHPPLDELLYLLYRHVKEHAVARRSMPEILLLEKTSDRLRGWHNVPGEVAQLQFQRNWEWLEDIALTALPPEPELSDGDLAALSPLAGGNRELIDFACHLLRRLRLLSGKDRVVAHEDVLRRFLRYSPQLRRAIVARAWLDLTAWHELNLVLHRDASLRLRRFAGRYSAIKPKDVAESILHGRSLLVRLLSALEEGVWYSFPALADTLRRLRGSRFADQRFGHQDGKPQWWIELDYGAKLDPSEPDDWNRGYAPIIQAMLSGPLAWLGVVSLCQSDTGLAFRVDGLAALLAGTTESSQAKSLLSVSDDLGVTVPSGYTDLSVHDYLQQVAEAGEATPEGLCYRFTAVRARDAFAVGYNAPSILAFLEKAAASVPASFRDALLEWHRRYGDLHLYANLTLVEFADDFVLPELLASTTLPRHLVYRFSPRLIAIDPKAGGSFIDELVRKGHTPKVIAGVE